MFFDVLECRCFYERTFVRVEFLHLREKTKIKRFTGFSGIRFYVGELCRLNYVGELCESRKMKSRAELSAKPKHNIKSFSKFKELPSLEVTRTDE